MRSLATMLTLALLVGLAAGQTTAKKVTHSTPPELRGIKLTAEQRKAIYQIQDTYRPKVAELQQKIADLRAEERLETFKVLTKEQRSQFLKLVGAE
jgi:Spy/CpxP family protein refolding chaperone